MIAIDVSDTDRMLPFEERQRITHYQLRRRARRRAQVARAEAIRKEAAEEMAARRAAAPQGWREQCPEDRTQVVKVPNRVISVRKGSRFDWPAAVLFAVVAGLLLWGMARPEKPQTGESVATSNNDGAR